MKTYKLFCTITNTMYIKKAPKEDQARRLLAFELNLPIQSILVAEVIKGGKI